MDRARQYISFPLFPWLNCLWLGALYASTGSSPAPAAVFILP